MMSCWYNENDPFAAQWLRNLVAAGHIAPGDVDERDMREVGADEIGRYDQCHFFAGIGGWSLALRLAGWPDDRPVWTGSCPCQPFSTAGKRQGGADDRHLWPHWFNLIRECKPAIIFGEQVEAAIGWGWLDAVCADLEAEGYATGAAVLPAASVGAPHIRQRVWFVAQSHNGEQNRLSGYGHAQQSQHGKARRPSVFECASGRCWSPVACDGFGYCRELANADAARCGTGRAGEAGNGRNAPRLQPAGFRVDELGNVANAMPARRPERRAIAGNGQVASGGALGELANANGGDAGTERLQRSGQYGQQPENSGTSELAHADEQGSQGRSIDTGEHPGECVAGQASPWDDLVWLPCSDGKARPTQSGLQPLAHGVPGRVGRLRAYGNAIIPQTAAEFIRSSQRRLRRLGLTEATAIEK